MIRGVAILENETALLFVSCFLEIDELQSLSVPISQPVVLIHNI